MINDSAETWRPVVGWVGLYEVSDLGRIRSQPRMTATGMRGGRVLKMHEVNGYYYVTLSASGRRNPRKVHQLVCEAFTGPRPDGLIVRHLNGDAHDNRAVNVKWGTFGENSQDKVLHGRDHNASKTHCPQKHEYTPDNIYWRGPVGKRRRDCKTCIRERSRTRPETHRA